MGKINLPAIEQVEAYKPLVKQSEEVFIADEVMDTPSTPKEEDYSAELVGLKMFFGIDIEDQSEDQVLKDIFNWAKSKGITDRNGLQAEIRKIETKIGVGLLNGTRPKQIKDYIVIASQFNESKKKLEAMKGKL